MVNDTLAELGMKDSKQVLVFNKIDLLEPGELVALKKAWPDALFVSAERGIGLGKLKKHLEKLIEEDYVEFDYNVPLSHYKAVAYLHEVANVEQEQYEGDHVLISGSTSKAERDRFESMLAEIK